MACKDCNEPEGKKKETDSENYKYCTNVFNCSLVCVPEAEQPCFCRSSTSVYYTECKLKNKKGGGLGTRLSTVHSCAYCGFVEVVGVYQLPVGPRR